MVILVAVELVGEGVEEAVAVTEDWSGIQAYSIACRWRSATVPGSSIYVKGQLTAVEIPRVNRTSLSWVGSERQTEVEVSIHARVECPSSPAAKQSIQKRLPQSRQAGCNGKARAGMCFLDLPPRERRLLIRTELSCVHDVIDGEILPG